MHYKNREKLVFFFVSTSSIQPNLQTAALRHKHTTVRTNVAVATQIAITATKQKTI